MRVATSCRPKNNKVATRNAKCLALGMLEDSIIVGNQPLRWHPYLQNNAPSHQYSDHISTLIPGELQEELKLQPTGQLRNVELAVEKETMLPFGLQKPEILNTAEKFMTKEQDGYGDLAANTDSALVASLKICAKEKDLRKGRLAHNELIRRRLLMNNVFVGTSLINMYAKCGVLDIARQVFHELSEKNEVTWNTLLAGYAQHGRGEEALRCSEQMQDEGT
ncbi:hypothetical protein L7F22_031865 [Adiantum nelumboides]|nr:hypothetical protein [Adiantum nelumboides]